MTTKNVHFEGQTNGTSITVANSTTYGDDALSRVNSTNGVIAYSTDVAAHGTRSAKITMNSGATSGVLTLGLGGVSSTSVGARCYLYLNSLPSSAVRAFGPFASGGVNLGGFNINSNGTVLFTDTSGTGLSGSQSNSTTQVLSLNTWYRFEGLWNISATAGSYKGAIYVGDSTTAWYSYTSATNLNSGTSPIVEVQVGKITNSQTFTGAWYVDDLAINDATTSFIGPFASTGPSVSTTVTPGYAKIDATGSTASAGGALTYSISPSTGTIQPSTGIFYVPQSSSATTYALTVAEAGAGSTTKNVVVPALTAAASSQTTVMTQRYIGGSWQ